MYEQGTILKLKEPRSTEDEPFAYDRVEVVGTSPIDHGLRSEEWVGAAGQGVLLVPIDHFGSTLDEPEGKVRRLYDIESTPEPVNPDLNPKVKVITPERAGPSPEDVFADEAVAAGKDDGRKAKRKREVVSPLDGDPDPEQEAARQARREELLKKQGLGADSPLGDA